MSSSRRVRPLVRTLMLVAVAATWEIESRAQAPTPAPSPAQAPGHAAAAPAQPVETAAPAGDAHAQPAAARTGQAEAGHAGGAQPGGAQADHAAEGAHGAEHGESTLAFAARIANFLILVGGLYYFLRKPIGDYLTARDQQIRGALITAKETTAAATAQLAEIDRKLQALPAEIAALKTRGAEEIASEEARIRQTAAAERQRLIEQARREIDLQVRLATRALTEQAATLAVDLATTRITETITPDDQARLIARYATQVRQAHD